MNRTPQKERKSRFQLSREVREEFVGGIARLMLSLSEKEKFPQPYMREIPFCPVTGKEYGGANMVRLMLTGMEKGYDDNRWLTFKQLQTIRDEHPDLNIRNGSITSKRMPRSNLPSSVPCCERPIP